MFVLIIIQNTEQENIKLRNQNRIYSFMYFLWTKLIFFCTYLDSIYIIEYLNSDKYLNYIKKNIIIIFLHRKNSWKYSDYWKLFIVIDIRV